jgi:hypothetical protein
MDFERLQRWSAKPPWWAERCERGPVFSVRTSGLAMGRRGVRSGRVNRAGVSIPDALATMRDVDECSQNGR